MGRAPCCDKANVKKGPWSPEEDAKLKAFIEQNGTGGNWIALPQKAGLRRCGKSCRLRWLNYLRPDIKHGGFSEEEDNVICNLYATIGSRWSIIAAQLPGRTDNDIKNYWNTKLKKKLLGKHTARRGLINAGAKELESLSKVGKQYYYVTEGMSASTIAIGSDQDDVLYGSDPAVQNHEMNMTLNSPYGANLGPPMVFEHAPNSDHASCVINFQSPLKPTSGFVNINPRHDHDQELEAKMADNSCLRNLLLRIESVLSDCSTNNNNTSAQISSSNISSQIYSPSTTTLDHNPGLQSDSFEIASRISMNVKSEPVGAFDVIHALNSSMPLRDSCSSSSDQSAAWLNGLNAAQEYMNYLGYEFNPMELNEALQWNNNNNNYLIQQQQKGEVPCNYSCRVSADEDLYASAISWTAHHDEEPSNCSDPKLVSCVPPYDVNGNQQGIIFQEEIIYE